MRARKFIATLGIATVLVAGLAAQFLRQQRPQARVRHAEREQTQREDQLCADVRLLRDVDEAVRDAGEERLALPRLAIVVRRGDAHLDRPDRRDESFGRNPHARDNVNVAQGPRTGNNPAQGKRNKFKDAKESLAPLAKVIQGAYAKRQHEYKEFEYTNGGSIMDNVNEGKRKRK